MKAIVRVYQYFIHAAITSIFIAGSALSASAAPFAYVPIGNSIQVLDLATSGLVAVIPLVGANSPVALAPDGKTVYVVSLPGGGFNGDIVAIDTATYSIKATIPVYGLPWDMVVNPSNTRLYVTLNAAEAAAVLDTTTNTWLGQVSLVSVAHDSPSGLTLDSTGQKLFVAHYGWGGTHNRISIIDTASMETATPQVQAVTVGGGPADIAVHPVMPRAYVTQYGYFGGGSTVTVVDTDHGTVVATVPVQNTPYGVVASNDGKYVYVGNHASSSISVIDTTSNSVVKTIGVGLAPYGMTLSSDGSRLYVSNRDDGTLSIIDLTQHVVIGSVVAGQPGTGVYGQFIFESPKYPFVGFFAPIDNGRIFNTAKAGSAIPVKFSLGGDLGMNIFAGGYPRTQLVQCDGGTPLVEVEETVNAGASSLTYDAQSGRYHYVWKTDPAWAKSCRQLQVTFTDGYLYTAYFSFR